MPIAESQRVIPCGVVTNHPDAEGKAVRWNASAERVGGDVLLIHNAIPRLEHFTEIAAAASDLFQSATVVDVGMKEHVDQWRRRCGELSLGGDGCPDNLLFFDLLCRSTEAGFLRDYIQTVNPHAVVHVGSGYKLLRYQEGDFHREHVDTTRDHPVLGHRRLSTVLFCNDDFDGGQLVFPRQGLTIVPRPGLMVVFPSGITHPHEVTPVAKGTRYTIASWFF